MTAWMTGPAVADNDGSVYYDFGIFAFEDGDFESAAKNFEKALHNMPDNPACRHFLGKTYMKMGRYEDAEAALTGAWLLDPAQAELDYDLALTKFHLRKIEEATFLFAEVLSGDPQNVLANYYLGQCYYRREIYRKAAIFFINAANASPSVKPNAYFYAGLCDMQQSHFAQALEKFGIAADGAPDEDLRLQAEKWRATAAAKLKGMQPYSIFFKLSGQYDDNVPFEPADQDLYTDEADWAGIGQLSAQYHFIKTPSFTAGLGYAHYQSLYRDLTEFNLIGSTPNLFASVALSRFRFNLSYLPTYFWIDSKDYLMRHKFQQDTIWRITPAFNSRLSLQYSADNHFVSPDRSGATLTGAGDLYYVFSSRKDSLFCGIQYELKTADHPDYEYHAGDAKIGMVISLPFNFQTHITGRYSLKQYRNIDSNYAEKRKDDKFALEISLARALYSDWLFSELSYACTHNESNIPVYSYRRNVFSVSAILRF